MTKIFTENDVVSYVYGEASTNTSQEIHIARLENDQLDQEIDAMESVVAELDQLVIKAPTGAVQGILDYSASSSLESA